MKQSILKQLSKSKQKHDKNNHNVLQLTNESFDHPQKWQPGPSDDNSASEKRAWVTVPQSSWPESHSAGTGYCWQ